MDENRIDGSLRQGKGAVTQALGKALGDAKMQSDGIAEQAAGKLQNAIGGVSDALRDAVKEGAEPFASTNKPEVAAK